MRQEESPLTDLVNLFKALSDEARLRILHLILEAGRLYVCDLQNVLGYTQTKVSRHLAYLKHAGILEDCREGAWVVYTLADTSDPHVRTIMDDLRAWLRKQPVMQADSRRLRQLIEQSQCASLCILETNANGYQERSRQS